MTVLQHVWFGSRLLPTAPRVTRRDPAQGGRSRGLSSCARFPISLQASASCHGPEATSCASCALGKSVAPHGHI